MLVGRGSARQCFNLTIPVTISALNYVFDLSPASTNIDATNFILDWTRQGSNYLAQITAGQRNVSGTYSLGATYCVPDSTGISPPSTILLLTHGISFDRSYWDLPLAAYNYSFVLPATSAPYNFATLAWDRLGIAQSLPPNADAVNEIQSYLEIAALEALAKGLKTGSLATAPLNGHKFDKVVGIGHSFGSGQTYSVAQQNPDYSAFDAIVLTGFSQNATFVPYFALGGNFVAEGSGVSGYPTGYLAAGDPGGVQTNFLSPGMFDAAALQYAFSPAGKPVSVGELLTIGGYTGMTSNFPGPTLIITGGTSYKSQSNGFLAQPNVG